VESFLTERNISLKGDFVEKRKPLKVNYLYDELLDV
jgi:hypothetical protein